MVYRALKAAKKRQALELWQQHFLGKHDRSTVELRVVNRRVVVTAEPDNMKAVLATQFSDFAKGEEFHEEWREFLGDSIFATDGKLWQTSRGLIRPQFTRDRVSDLHCFESHMNVLFRAMANGGALDGEDQHVDMAAGNGRAVDMADLFYRYTLDVTTDFLLGADVKSLSTPRQDFADAFNGVQSIQATIVRASAFNWMVPRVEMRRKLALINKFIHRFIDKALKMTPEELDQHSSDKEPARYTFLHALAKFTKDPQVIRDQVLAVLLAGRDTTAGTLSWAVYELARHPECVAKLRAEILDTVGPSDAPTYEHLKNMPYLKAIINETLRLYPSVPFNARVANEDTVLPRGGGPDGSEPLPVLRGGRVVYSTLVMQRRADLYPPVSDTFADPLVFSPERWEHWHPKPHEYIPFNAGPRICVGQQFALTEMSYVLVRIFQRFKKLESHMFALDGGKPALKTDIVISPAQGVHVSFWET